MDETFVEKHRKMIRELTQLSMLALPLEEAEQELAGCLDSIAPAARLAVAARAMERSLPILLAPTSFRPARRGFLGLGRRDASPLWVSPYFDDAILQVGGALEVAHNGGGDAQRIESFSLPSLLPGVTACFTHGLGGLSWVRRDDSTLPGIVATTVLQALRTAGWSAGDVAYSQVTKSLVAEEGAAAPSMSTRGRQSQFAVRSSAEAVSIDMVRALTLTKSGEFARQQEDRLELFGPLWLDMEKSDWVAQFISQNHERPRSSMQAERPRSEVKAAIDRMRDYPFSEDTLRYAAASVGMDTDA